MSARASIAAHAQLEALLLECRQALDNEALIGHRHPLSKRNDRRLLMGQIEWRRVEANQRHSLRVIARVLHKTANSQKWAKPSLSPRPQARDQGSFLEQAH